MRFTFNSCCSVVCLLTVYMATAFAQENDYKAMFNGQDLSGWHVVNGTLKDDANRKVKATWKVENGVVITTGKPTGFMRTEKHYENFELEMEWMHINKKEVGNSGLFVWGDPFPAIGTGYTRGIEVQVLVNYPDVGWATNHGDLFSIWGAKCKPDRPHPKGIERCLPSENRSKGGGEWNHYKVIAKDGVIKLHVNGKEVSGVSECSPRKGYLALESEGAECHFRNVKIKELPGSNPKESEVANTDQGHETLFDGQTLAGWQANAEDWKVTDGVLKCLGKTDLIFEKEVDFAKCKELFFDYKLPKNSSEKLTIQLAGDEQISLEHQEKPNSQPRSDLSPGWNRVKIKCEESEVKVMIENRVIKSVKMPMKPGKFVIKAATAIEIRNIFLASLLRAKP